MAGPSSCFFFFFFNDTATTEIYTLSLHDALPISPQLRPGRVHGDRRVHDGDPRREGGPEHVGRGLLRRGDRKSTRLNSSHLVISYAVFCLEKKRALLGIDLLLGAGQLQPEPRTRL